MVRKSRGQIALAMVITLLGSACIAGTHAHGGAASLVQRDGLMPLSAEDGSSSLATLESPLDWGSAQQVAGPWGRKKKEPTAEQVMDQIQKTADALYPVALKAGQAILVIPTLNVEYKYAGHSAAELTTVLQRQYEADLSFLLHWEKEGDPGKKLLTGYSRNAMYYKYRGVGASGTFYQVTGGPSLYQVYVVEPGTYNLVGQSFEIRETSAPKSEWGNVAATTGGVGEIVMNELKRPK